MPFSVVRDSRCPPSPAFQAGPHPLRRCSHSLQGRPCAVICDARNTSLGWYEMKAIQNEREVQQCMRWTAGAVYLLSQKAKLNLL